MPFYLGLARNPSISAAVDRRCDRWGSPGMGAGSRMSHVRYWMDGSGAVYVRLSSLIGTRSAGWKA